jgi:DNA-binding transcriptional regulator YhcF (GntR family)
VARAYSELEREGVVVTEGARGTRVAERAGSGAPLQRPETLAGLLRPVAVAAFHLGADADELRAALEVAMTGIFDKPADGV